MPQGLCSGPFFSIVSPLNAAASASTSSAKDKARTGCAPESTSPRPHRSGADGRPCHPTACDNCPPRPWPACHCQAGETRAGYRRPRTHRDRCRAGWRSKRGMDAWELLGNEGAPYAFAEQPAITRGARPCRRDNESCATVIIPTYRAAAAVASFSPDGRNKFHDHRRRAAHCRNAVFHFPADHRPQDRAHEALHDPRGRGRVRGVGHPHRGARTFRSPASPTTADDPVT